VLRRQSTVWTVDEWRVGDRDLREVPKQIRGHGLGYAAPRSFELNVLNHQNIATIVRCPTPPFAALQPVLGRLCTGSEYLTSGTQSFQRQVTAPLNHNASSSDVDTALEALQAVDTVTVTGNAGGPWTVTFTGAHAGLNVSVMNGDAASLTSGTLLSTLNYGYDLGNQLTSTSDSNSTYAFNLGRVLTVSNSGTSGVPTVVLTSAYDASSNHRTGGNAVPTRLVVELSPGLIEVGDGQRSAAQQFRPGSLTTPGFYAEHCSSHSCPADGRWRGRFRFPVQSPNCRP